MDATRMTVPQVVKPAKSANDFGGSFGGPLWGKHTFFFGDYEGMRYRTQRAEQKNVPSQAMRDGDFWSLLPGTIVHDVDGTPFPGNKIPTGQFDPRAAAILNFYPLPNASGDFNYAVNVPNPILSDQFDIRIDHTLNSKQSVFGRWTYKNGRRLNPSGLLLPAESDFEHDNQIVIAHNYTITPSLINELRGGMSRRQSGGNFPLDGPAFMQKLGLNSTQLGPFPPGGFPDFVFEPRSTIDNIFHTRPNPELSRNFQVNENLTWIKGKHTMKFGFDLRKLHLIPASHSGSHLPSAYADSS